MNAVAVVTGAASGIGRATALHLARDGFDVAMVDLDTVGLAVTHDQIKAFGGLARAFVVDLCDPLAVGSIAREIAVTSGAPEVLVNVAGIGVAATVLETSDEDWNRVLAVNLTGPFLTTRAILPLMLDRGHGVIVNIASVAGQVGVPRCAAYCASKAGLVGLTKAIAVDHAREGIRSVAICPGTVETEWIGRVLSNAPDPAAAREAMAARQLDGRMGTPEEIAAMVAFVAGPSGRFINGAALVVDGGMTAGMSATRLASRFRAHGGGRRVPAVKLAALAELDLDSLAVVTVGCQRQRIAAMRRLRRQTLLMHRAGLGAVARAASVEP